MPSQPLDVLLVEHLRDQPHLLPHADVLTIADGDPRGLLPAMLQRVQAEVRQVRDVLARMEHAEDAALLVEVIVHQAVPEAGHICFGRS